MKEVGGAFIWYPNPILAFLWTLVLKYAGHEVDRNALCPQGASWLVPKIFHGVRLFLFLTFFSLLWTFFGLFLIYYYVFPRSICDQNISPPPPFYSTKREQVLEFNCRQDVAGIINRTLIAILDISDLDKQGYIKNFIGEQRYPPNTTLQD